MKGSTLWWVEWTPEIEEWLRRKFSYDPNTGIVKNADTGREAGCFDRDTGYRSICFSNVLIRSQGVERYTIGTHRLAWFLAHGNWPNKVDHINLMRDDNRLENLRIANEFENSYNRPKCSRRCHSQHKGVTWHSRDKVWIARIQVDGKRVHLGEFASEEAAADAYKAAAIRLHGEFAPITLRQEEPST